MKHRLALAIAAVLTLNGCVRYTEAPTAAPHQEKGAISGELMQGWQKIPTKKTASKSSAKARAVMRRKKTAAASPQPDVRSDTAISETAADTAPAAAEQTAAPVVKTAADSTAAQRPPVNTADKPLPAAPEQPAAARQAELPIRPKTAVHPQEERSAAPETKQTASILPDSGSRSAVFFLVQKADKELKIGNLDVAAIHLENALSLNPNNAAIRFDIANIRYHQGRFKEAEKQAGLAIQSAGRSNIAIVKKSWALIANSRKEQGDSQGAIRAAEQAASISEAQYNY